MPVIESIDAFSDELIAIRRDIHQHPELGFEEVRTAGLIAARLASWGVEVHSGIGKTGVVGVVRGSSEGTRMIGLRADMDALPMEEETGLSYASKYPGRFHGCGHDSHVAMLLGAARYLSQTRNFAGTAALIFQPAEEGLGGARAMIADRLFQRFPCDEISRSIPLPMVAELNGVTAVYPATASTVSSILSAIGAVIPCETIEEFDACAIAASLMGFYFGIADTCTLRLGSAGMPYPKARAYMAHLLHGLADTALNAPDADFEQLRVGHTTPGGLNDQLFEHFRTAGGVSALAGALDTVAGRIRKARD